MTQTLLLKFSPLSNIDNKLCSRSNWMKASTGFFFCQQMPPFNSVYNFPHHHHTVTITWHQVFPEYFRNSWERGGRFHFDSSACMHQFEDLQHSKPNQTNELQFCAQNEFNCRIIHIQTTVFFFLLSLLSFYSIESNVICMRFDKAFRHHLLFDSNSVILSSTNRK